MLRDPEAGTYLPRQAPPARGADTLEGDPMKRGIALAAGGLAAGALMVYGVGRSLPPDHSATVVDTLASTADVTWDALTDVWAYPQWRPGVDAVEIIALDGRPAWRETGSAGELTFEIVSVEPTRRMVTRIADETLPFGGTWSWTLDADGDATIVTVREDGVIRSPVFRFFARYVFGYTGTMETYLAALADRVSA
jgi:hypothetical protein